MSDQKCYVVNGECTVPANAPGRTRAKCYACGMSVCKAVGCSRKMHWYGRNRRVCYYCAGDDRQPEQPVSRVVMARGLPVRLSEAQYRMLLDVRKDGKRKYNGRARRTIEILESLGLVKSSYSFRFAGLSGRTVDEYTVTAVPS